MPALCAGTFKRLEEWLHTAAWVQVAFWLDRASKDVCWAPQLLTTDVLLAPEEGLPIANHKCVLLEAHDPA